MAYFYTAVFKVCVHLFLHSEKSINLPQSYKVPAVFTGVVIIFAIWLQLMIVLIFELDIDINLSCYQSFLTYNQNTLT